MNQPIDEIAGIINRSQRILVLTHVYPDGDALGSQLGLGFILDSMGKEVFRYGEDAVSYIYDFLPGCNRLRKDLPESLNFDCAIALDCGDSFRLGRAMDRLLGVHPFMVIDHHEGHKDFGDLRWVDSSRASTGEMVFDLAGTLGAEIGYEAAYCLYTAIVSDTGSFKYSSTTADTFRVAQELLRKGVKPAEVSGKLFDNFTLSRLRLLESVLTTLALYENDRLALITVSQEMFDRTGASQSDVENFINYPRSLATVRVAAFIKETKDGRVSVSLRSKGSDCDVARVASSFGGGGHRNAAGFKLAGTTIAEVREKLLAELLPMVRS